MKTYDGFPSNFVKTHKRIEIEEILPRASLLRLDANTRGFLKRTYSGDLGRYRKRLEAIRFTKLGRVLDAGCGFGQWSIVMARLNREVAGIDISPDRIRIASKIARSQGLKIDFLSASIGRIPHPDGYFDAIFCYGAIFFMDEEQAISEFRRVLKPGGKLYVCFNALGWYLFLIFRRGLHGDFFSLKEGLKTFWNQLRGSRKGSHVISRGRMRQVLMKTGFKIVSLEAEGCIRLNSRRGCLNRFFPGNYLGFDAVLEVVAEKL